MRYHRLNDKKTVLILKSFCEEVTAVSALGLVGVSCNTINSYYKEIRERIFSQTLKEHQQELGEFELDESYLHTRQTRSQSGR